VERQEHPLPSAAERAQRPVVGRGGFELVR